jgi:hypothetical protein
MNSANISVGASAPKRARKSKNQRRTRTRSSAASSPSAAHPERDIAAAGTLTRTKALLLAALRVWELKHRISD